MSILQMKQLIQPLLKGQFSLVYRYVINLTLIERFYLLQ